MSFYPRDLQLECLAYRRRSSLTLTVPAVAGIALCVWALRQPDLNPALGLLLFSVAVFLAMFLVALWMSYLAFHMRVRNGGVRFSALESSQLRDYVKKQKRRRPKTRPA